VDDSKREDEQQTFKQQQRERRVPRQTFIQQRQQEFGDIEWLRRQLAQWANRCGICQAAGNEQSEHDVRHCWREVSRAVKKAIQEQEDAIHYQDFSGCFLCGVPTQYEATNPG
jgi:hypothetical protein